MSDTIKLKDKISGETITLRLKPVSSSVSQISQPKKSFGLSDSNRIAGDVAQEMQQRGRIQDIGKDFQSPNIVKKGIGTLRTVGAPLTMLEAGIANPALAIQSGNYNPLSLAKESIAGFTGQKLGEYGDVMRIGGFPKPIAATTGLALSMSPFKAINMVGKTFGRISKLSDKGIIRAGESLLKATDEAKTFAGTNLKNIYKGIDNIAVDSSKFIDNITKLPKPLVGKLEEVFGRLDEFGSNLTIGRLRELKQTIGKYKPSTFGKGERGLAENLEAEDINKVYGAIKKLLNETVEQAVGKKTAQALLKADEAFTEVSNSSDYIRKLVVESTLKKPTKAGAIAKRLQVQGDVSGREALNVLKGSGKKARKEINKAVSALEAFNKWQMVAQFGQHAANAALFGGAIGGVGGFVGSKIYNRQSD
jgi:hypothetical protein